MNTISIRSASQLLGHRNAWNRLSQASSCHLPTVRAEPLANYLNTFHPADEFLAIVVTDAGRWVAALPLLINKSAGLVRIGKSTSNPWSFNHDFLVLPDVNIVAVADAIKRTLSQENVAALKLDWVDCEAPHWARLLQGFRGCRSHVSTEIGFQVGTIELDRSWQEYQGRLSKNFRKQLKRNGKKLEQLGQLSFWSWQDDGGSDLISLIQIAFELEDKTWKGKQNSSVMKNPGMFEFYLNQATCLDKLGNFELQFLMLDQRPIAFEYGYMVGKTYFSHKVSYDPAFSACSPGQLLVERQLKSWVDNGKVKTINTMGAISLATSRWAPSVCSKGSVLISAGGFLTADICRIYSNAKRIYKHLRGKSQTDTTKHIANRQSNRQIEPTKSTTGC